MCKISVIIPIYNVENYLKKLLESILEQKFADLEVLLIDDGSTDASGAICDELATKDDRVEVFHIPNGGVSKARNFGLQKAKGEYIHFVDSDDLVEKDMYANFSKVVEMCHPDIVMCGSLQIDTRCESYTVVAPSDEKYLNCRSKIVEYLNHISMDNMKCLIHYVWNKWYRKDFLKKNNLAFSPKLNLGEDYVFNCLAVKAIESIYILPNTYYHYFIRGNSLVSAFQPEPWKTRQMLFDAHKALYEAYGIWNDNQNDIMLEEGKMCFVALRSINGTNCKIMGEKAS